MTSKIITQALLKSWSPCADGFRRFCELFPDGADLETAITGLVGDDKDDWAFWLFDMARRQGGFEIEVAKGYRNSGYSNSGYSNSGDRNSGDRNSGDRNSGDRNSGYRNSGYSNSGYSNSGDSNSGYRNSGDRNSGYSNSGDRNSGDRNSGYRNSGDSNSGNYNTGHFNTVTPEDILVFNKPCKRAVWDAAPKPDLVFSYFNGVQPCVWVNESAMTDAEKKANPNFYVAQGYLKKVPYKEAYRIAWDAAPPEDRAKLLALPNFDAAVFEEISGIDVNEKAPAKKKVK